MLATCKDDAAGLERSLRDEVGGGGGTIAARELDLTCRDSVAAFASWTEGRVDGRLHVLVNNAGILLDVLSRWREPRLAADGIEVHWRTNYLGTFDLTRALLPLLLEAARRDGDARVLNVVSHQHTRGSNESLNTAASPPRYNSWDAYGLSKLALIHFSGELHRRHGGDGRFRAVSLHPGSAHTNMIRTGLAAYPGLRPVSGLLNPLAGAVLLTPCQGAQTVLHCATAPGIAGGGYYERCEAGSPSPAARDEDAARRLWDDSERWLEGDAGGADA